MDHCRDGHHGPQVIVKLTSVTIEQIQRELLITSIRRSFDQIQDSIGKIVTTCSNNNSS